MTQFYKYWEDGKKTANLYSKFLMRNLEDCTFIFW